VSVFDAAARPTAVGRAATTWHRDDPAELRNEVGWLLS
jgi:hypothetical protein